MLTIIETFYSLEGEGPHIGKPTFFIRLSGCNLRCTWTPAGEEPILTDEMKWKKARNVKKGDRLIGFSNGTFKRAKVLNTIKTRSETVKITTESGKSIVVTPEHPFYVSGTQTVRADRSIGKEIRVINEGDVAIGEKIKVEKDLVVKIEYSGVRTINHFETETHNYISGPFASHNCDTKYSYSGGYKRSVDDLIQEAQQYGTKLVSITGGEPLLQPDVYPLMHRLLDNEFTIILETSGSISIENVPTEDNMIISMDIKTPSSNMVEHNLYENIELLGKKDYLKFVIEDDNDFQFSKSIIEKYPFDGEIIFQPEGGKNLKELAEKVLKERLNIRVLPQLHKFIWGDKRGV
ncbi:MAG: radical SAM protein [Thermoplasmatales archaeon]